MKQGYLANQNQINRTSYYAARKKCIKKSQRKKREHFNIILETTEKYHTKWKI